MVLGGPYLEDHTVHAHPILLIQAAERTHQRPQHVADDVHLVHEPPVVLLLEAAVADGARDAPSADDAVRLQLR